MELQRDLQKVELMMWVQLIEPVRVAVIVWDLLRWRLKAVWTMLVHWKAQ